MIDFEADAAELSSEPKDTQSIEDLVEAALHSEEVIREIEDALRAEKKRLKDIMEKGLPDAMSRVGLSEIGTSNGARVKLGPVAYGSLNKAEDIERAIAYLEENGLRGGVLTEVTVRFTEDERDDAEVFAMNAGEATHKDVLRKRDLNSSTLRSFVRQRFEEDPSFDPAVVGCTVHTIAKFTLRGK